MYNLSVCVLLDASIVLWYYYIQDTDNSSQSGQISSIDIQKRICGHRPEELHLKEFHRLCRSTHRYAHIFLAEL